MPRELIINLLMLAAVVGFLALARGL